MRVGDHPACEPSPFSLSTLFPALLVYCCGLVTMVFTWPLSLSETRFLPLLNLRVIPKSPWASPPRCPTGMWNSVCLRPKPSRFPLQTYSASFASNPSKHAIHWHPSLRISLDASLSCTDLSHSISHRFYFLHLFQNDPLLSVSMTSVLVQLSPLCCLPYQPAPSSPISTLLQSIFRAAANGIFCKCKYDQALHLASIIQWLPNALGTKAKLLSII